MPPTMARAVALSLLACSLASPLIARPALGAPSLSAFVSARTHVPGLASLSHAFRGSQARRTFATDLPHREPAAATGVRRLRLTLLARSERGTGELGDDNTARIQTVDPDSPVKGKGTPGSHEDAVLLEAAFVGAVAVAIATFLAPSDAAATSTASVELVAQASAAPVDVGAIFAKAGRASIGGGVSGAAAAVVQVLSLMWLRTTMNFQYKNGGSTQNALQTLWEEGGIPRLYRGISFALVQGPLSRFGDTAANVGVLALLEAFESTRSLPLPVKSAAGSAAAGVWRIGLTPIDSYKTTLQVSGAEGTKMLADKVAANGPGVLFEGALATATATFVGHYPWYYTYNSLGAMLPLAPTGEPLLKLGRQAFLGICSSCVSDCCSNSIRVVKTTKQTAPVPISYPEALKEVVDKDGVAGLFVRGLKTRILVNALQGALFAVAWKYFEEVFRTGGL